MCLPDNLRNLIGDDVTDIIENYKLQLELPYKYDKICNELKCHTDYFKNNGLAIPQCSICYIILFKIRTNDCGFRFSDWKENAYDNMGIFRFSYNPFYTSRLF